MTMDSTNNQHDQALAEIARRHLCIPTLETRHSDQMDFHHIAVWSVRAALEEAFHCGRSAAGISDWTPAMLEAWHRTYVGATRRETRIAQLEAVLEAARAAP